MIEQRASTRDLVEFVAKGLVDQPDAVQVSEAITEQGVTIQLRVAPDDVGKVIGKRGRIINALRTALKAAAVQSRQRVTVEIVHEPSLRE